jgi:hypothetical protein
MLSPNVTVHLPHVVNGVVFSIQNPGYMKVTFNNSLDYDTWQEFTKTMIEMIKENYLQWDFNLQELNDVQSIDIGMWVMCNARVTSLSGNLVIIVKQNSSMHRVLSITKVDKNIPVKPV